MIAWPTKLALVPRLAAEILDALDPPADRAGPIALETLKAWPRPDIALPPWERELAWTDDV